MIFPVGVQCSTSWGCVHFAPTTTRRVSIIPLGGVYYRTDANTLSRVHSDTILKKAAQIIHTSVNQQQKLISLKRDYLDMFNY